MRNSRLKQLSSVLVISTLVIAPIAAAHPRSTRESFQKQIKRKGSHKKHKKGFFCATAYEIRLVDAEGEIVSQEDIDVLIGAPTRKVFPGYPARAVIDRVEGSVIVEGMVSDIGEITSLRSVSGHPDLTKASAEAAMKWRFTPTKIEGSPVPVIARITFKYDLGLKKGMRK
jgi:TonB family protein